MSKILQDRLRILDDGIAKTVEAFAKDPTLDPAQATGFTIAMLRKLIKILKEELP